MTAIGLPAGLRGGDSKAWTPTSGCKRGCSCCDWGFSLFADDDTDRCLRFYTDEWLIP